MDIRLAFPNEVAQVMNVIEDAKKVIATYGSDQWQNGYPNEDVIIDDILKGQAYVALNDEGTIVAYAAAIMVMKKLTMLFTMGSGERQIKLM